MKKYEQTDISGDVGLRVWGRTPEELFTNAAEGMGELITDTSLIEAAEKKKISISSDSIENLFIQWLNELVFLFDTYGLIGKIFSVDISSSHEKRPEARGERRKFFELKAEISGGIFNQEVNESRLLIKAATYHDLSVKKVNSNWEAEVIFDI